MLKRGGSMTDDYLYILDYCNYLQIDCENPYDELFYDYEERYDSEEEYYQDF